MTQYSESLHQMLPFLSKIHQNLWPVGPLGPTSILGPSAPSPPLAMYKVNDFEFPGHMIEIENFNYHH